MFSYIKTFAFAASFCLLIVSDVSAQSDDIEVVVKKEPVPVHITSGGGSRFSFDGKNVSVSYWGGVEIDYFGYNIKAEDLRYSKGQQLGSLEGNVVIASNGLTVNCTKVELDAAVGQLIVSGPLTGTIAEPQMAFTAGQARFTFSPGKAVSELGDIDIELVGSVLFETQAGMQFSSKGFSYNGATAELQCIGSFNLEAASLALPNSDGSGNSGLTNLLITGESLVGYIDGNGLLQSAEIRLLEITSREVFLESALATISAHSINGDNSGWEMSIEGNPLSGGVHQENHDIMFTASSAQMEIGQLGLETMEMIGGVKVELEDSVMQAENVNIERTVEGYVLSFPGNLMVNFDMYEMSGGDMVEGGAIEQWLGS